MAAAVWRLTWPVPAARPRSRVITDGWAGYTAAALGYAHERRNQKAAARRGEDLGNCCPPSTGSPQLC